MSLKVPWSLCLMNVCCQLLGKSVSWSLSCRPRAAWLGVTVWLMCWMRSTTESNSHSHCASGMGQLHHILGHTYCWGSSFFFLPSHRPGLGEPGSGQQPWCCGEGHDSLNIYSSVGAQGGDAAFGLWPFLPAAGCVPAPHVPLDGSAGTGADGGMWCSSTVSVV